jgi:LSU ribosomal protein L5P
MTRLQNFYKEQVIAKLTEQFGYQNVMQVPRISKITLNMGVGEAAANKKVLENATADMARIAGQKPSRPRRACPCLVQDPRRLADRLQGHLAPRDVSSSIA